MNKKYNWLELAEFFSVGSFFFGVITTAITKQILFSLTPLTFVIFFNTINRQKHHYQPDLYLQQAEYTKELYQDLITFSDDYKYQKLELEKLIEEAKKQRLEIERETKEYMNNNQFSSIVNRLNNLSANQDKVSNYVYSELDKFSQSLENLQRKSNQVSQLQASINTIESSLKKVENNQSDFNNNYQSFIGNSINLTGLSQYYPLQGLNYKLIREVKNNTKNLESENKRLDDYSIQCLKEASEDLEGLTNTVNRYYHDHQCSQQEANKLVFELSQLAITLRQCNSISDFKLVYKVLELFAFQISRFKHKKTHHSWDNFIRKTIIKRLDKCNYYVK